MQAVRASATLREGTVRRRAPRSPPGRPRLAALLLAVVALLLTALAPVSRADDALVGPPIGNNRWQTTISEPGDEDDFVGRFVEGDLLTVTVVAKRPSRKVPPSLLPRLVLVDPDGVLRSADVKVAPSGFATSVRQFRIDKAGVWAARVSGREGTTGACDVGFRVRSAPRVVIRSQDLGGASPFSREHRFGATDGALLTATVAWTKLSLPVEMRALTDPSGAAVQDAAGAPVVSRATAAGRRTVLRDVVLGHGTGLYTLRVRIPTGTAKYDLTLDLHSPGRPTSRKPVVLSATEPFLDPADVPFPGEVGDTIPFTGRGFSVSPPPVVRFGDAVSPSVTTSPDGRTLQVVVPPRSGPDIVVAVTVVNPDGQGVRRPLYFAFLPPPEIHDLLDAATGEPVRQASAAGGRVVRLMGANFLAGYTVKLGPVTVPSPVLVADGEFRLTLPPAPEGDHALSVIDPYRRTGVSDFTVFLKTPPSFAAVPYTPGAVRIATATSITMHGSNFQASDRFQVSGLNYPSTLLDDRTRTFDLPPLPAGSYAIRLIDSIGTVVDGPPVVVKAPPTIASVTVVAGPVLQSTQIPYSGGSTIQVDGTDLLANDVVTLGGAPVTTVVLSTPTRKQFVAPPAAFGLAALTIVDGAGQSATASNVVRYVGFADSSSARVPQATATDSLTSLRGAAGDLDNDGRADDVVIVSPLSDSPGTRAERTRVLFGDAAGVLRDLTASAFPAARSDATQQDTWDGTCVALGDLDGRQGLDVLVGGTVVSGNSAYQQVRAFTNDGSGNFALDLASSPPTRYASYVIGSYYYYYYYYAIYGPTPQSGSPQAIAVGDLDGNGSADLVVVGADHFQYRHVYLNPAYVNFATVPYPTIYGYYPVQYDQYFPATKVYLDRVAAGQGMVDVTADHLPALGDSSKGPVTLPALHARDLALSDLDKDANRRLDLVVAWNDPLTVSPWGLRSKETQGTSQDTARIATRILLNQGGEQFTSDVTATWMPTPSPPEYWQADRIALADLDGDGDDDLVLLSSRGLDAWTGTETHTRPALRVLRNDRNRFVDITSTAVPAVDAASGDDWRGTALAVRDVNGDGFKDILVSTTDALTSGGAALPRMRVFFGQTGFRFGVFRGFSAPAATDSGEARDLLFVGDLGGAGKPVLLLLGDAAPAASPSSTPRLRGQEWRR